MSFHVYLYCAVYFLDVVVLLVAVCTAQVMAGVLLGPSALGQIPGFTNKLFPDESLEALTLTAHLGLIL